MKNRVVLILLLAITSGVSAQVQQPANWLFAAKKSGGKSYMVTITANLQPGWHIYSQFTPDGGPIPTTFNSYKNPLLVMNNFVENGELEHKHEPLFGVDVKQFSGKVSFTQQITIKAPVKTRTVGTIKYMLCNEEKCLPPAIMQFSIALH